MRHLLIVVDMQNDFISGALGTKEAQAILPAVVQKVKAHQGPVLFTRDTHQESYLNTQEGRFLPVRHCIIGTEGWQIAPELEALRKTPALDKPAFGSFELGELLLKMHREDPISKVTLVGLCTDICVISNTLIVKAVLPEAEVHVDAACCAGATPQGHRIALDALKPCQVIIDNDL
ncbi:MAG: cysteine hydrolase [Bacillota bacterium]|nr:cysteine hydrolase [Bacillota bacterium]